MGCAYLVRDVAVAAREDSRADGSSGESGGEKRSESDASKHVDMIIYEGSGRRVGF